MSKLLKQLSRCSSRNKKTGTVLDPRVGLTASVTSEQPLEIVMEVPHNITPQEVREDSRQEQEMHKNRNKENARSSEEQDGEEFYEFATLFNEETGLYELDPVPVEGSKPVVEPVARIQGKSEETLSVEEDRATLVKRASKELLKLLTDPELADELAVECAEKVLQRYISPVMKEQELKVITEAEKALEEELLGLDKDIVQRLPKEVDECLCKRARAVAAAETVAKGNQSPERTLSKNSLSKRSSLETQSSKIPIEFGYADMAEIAKGAASPPPEVPLSTFAPWPSNAPSAENSETFSNRQSPSPLQAKLSRHFASFKHHLDEAELTAVYDRTYSWMKRSESKLANARFNKEQQNLTECTFKPSVLQRRKSNFSTEHADQRTQEIESSGSGMNDISTMDKACLRLYKRARQMHSKRYQRVEDLLHDEQLALRASSPKARPMPRNLYGNTAPVSSIHQRFSGKLRPLPSGVEECTFHPKTNVRRTWTLPDKKQRSSYWNIESFSMSGSGDDDCIRERSRESSNFATVASLESDLADALERSKPDSFDDGESQPISSKEKSTSVAAHVEHKEVRSPEDLVNAFLERLSQSKEFPKSMPLSIDHKGDDITMAKGYQSDSKTLAMHRRLDNDDRYKLTQFAGNCKFMTDVDFTQFLKRQEYYLILKTQKIKALRDKKHSSVKLSPGTKRILKDKRAQLEAAKSDAGNFVSPFSSDTRAGNITTSLTRKQHLKDLMMYDKECSFSPRITKKAQRMKSRTIDDIMKKNEKAQSLMETRKTEQELAELSELTFRPKLNYNLHVSSRLNLKDPEAYMAAIRHRQERQHIKEMEAEHKKQLKEMADCTFHPSICSLPISLKRELERKQKLNNNEETSKTKHPEWGYATKFQTTAIS